jgi:hypothetical protein
MRRIVAIVCCCLVVGTAMPCAAVELLNEEAILDAAADGKQYDSFGWSVAVSGSTAIVGAYADDVGTLRPGAAYVFVRSGTTWTRQQRLVAGDAANRDLFGASVAISGNTAIVGAWRGNGGFGGAYVFVRNGTTWTQQQKLTSPADLTGDVFGYAVGIDGNTAVVTTKNNNGVGAAHVFVRNGTTWTLQTSLAPVNSAAGDYFGFSTAIEGNTVVVGAIGDKAGSAISKGAATVFVRNGTTWSFQQKLSAADGVQFDRLGMSVALSGNTAIVGQVTADDNAQPLNQSAYAFVRNGTAWTQQGKLEAGDAVKGDGFGGSVAVSGDLALVGASNDDVGPPPAFTNEGSVYVFERIDGSWSPVGKLTASDQASGSAATGNLFGFSVGLSGTAAIVGAPNFKVGSNFYQGHAYPFVNPDTDGDSLPDEWESKGITLDGVFIDLPKMGADPRHKDVFVHADWMHVDPGDTTAVFKPYPRALKMVTDAFAQAPVVNPDGKVGINLHVDAGPTSIMNHRTRATWGALSRAGEIPYQATIGSVDAMGKFVWTAVDTIKQTHFTPNKREAVFHYVLFANDHAGSGGSSTVAGSSGVARDVPGTDFLVTLGTWDLRGGTEMQQAGTFMHELGHTLGLKHGGDDEVNGKPNYLSIMNYTFQMIGVLRSATQRRFDYSAYLLPPLDETALDETTGIAHPLHYLTLWNRLSSPSTEAAPNYCKVNASTYNRTFLPTDALDWNCNGVKDTSPVAGDINRDGDCILAGANKVVDSGATPDDDIRDDVRDGIVFDRIVWTGANRTCNTVRQPDDLEEHPVGYIEAGPVLTGFKDWSHLDFGGKGTFGSASGAPGPPAATTPLYEPTKAEILALSSQSLLDEELVAPHDDVTLSTTEGPAPLVVHFDGSASTAVGGATIATYAWDFGDGATDTGATTQHTYDTPGEYFASLTVTDSDGRVNLVPLVQLVTVTDDGAGPTPTPTATPFPPLGLDAFALYAAAPTKGGAKFPKLGRVALADAFTSGGFDVQKPAGLAVPAVTNGGSPLDPATSLAGYAVKASKGTPKPGPHANVRVANACGETVITMAKPVTLLVPSAVGLNASVAAPNENDHEVDHFLCYQAKPQKKDAAGTAVTPLPKGAQVDVVDLLETKRFDLKKIVALCVPVAKSGTPTVLSGPTKGTAFPLTPATVRHPTTHLLCYQAALAKKTIAQNGCGPATPGDKGTALVQAKHAPRPGVHVADQLGTRRVDTKKESLVCLPSMLPGP